jgi:N-methylhydantoinase A
MLSNGGLTNIDEAKRTPVQLLESGPAAGALVAAHLGTRDGGDHVLAFDMGGTTAKLSIVDGGKPTVAYSFEAAREKRFIEGSGLPVRISTLELIEIGAGGGSIAHLDDIGLLKVGPISSGSEPGPAAYGRGGTEPTVTDADFVLGYLNPAYFVGGTMAIDMQAGEAAMHPLARRASLSATNLAWGIHDLVNENMANAARVHIAEHGKDPRRYTLLATGGAGPVHAYYVAKKLGLKRLIAPRGAGVASALGLLIAPVRVDRVATIAREMGEIAWSDLEATFARLEAEAGAVLKATLPERATATIVRFADIRYVGQASELVVPLPPGPYTAASRPSLLQAFEKTYVAAFTRTPPTTQVEIINVRVSASVEVGRGGLSMRPAASRSQNPIKGKRPVYFPELRDFHPTTVYDRYALLPGQAFQGPAIVEERESTLVVGPGGRFEVAASSNIIVTIG